MPTISLIPATGSASVANTKATFHVGLQGFTVGQALELSFIEKADGNQASDRVLGTASGRASARVDGWVTPQFTMIPNTPPPTPPTGGGLLAPVLVAFRFPAGVKPDGTSSGESIYVFELFQDRYDVDEGDYWEFQVKCDSPKLSSATLPIARIRRQLENSAATYDWHDGHTLTFYHDGSTDEHGTGGAFKDVLAAIDQAQHFVFIADWSFQPMFCPNHGSTIADTIGSKLITKAKSTLVAIHTWDHTAIFGTIGAPDPQNDDGDDVLDELAGGTRPEKLLWRASSHDQSGMSHHQKYVLVDCPDPANSGRRALKAFFGGLDLTQGRFDWGDHPILPNDPRCAKFRTSVKLDGTEYNDWYNAEFGTHEELMNLPRQPWHDIHGMIVGPAAWDFVREFVGRWNKDPSITFDAQGDDGSDDIEAVLKLFRGLFDPKKFVQQWELHPGPWAAQVVRSMYKSHWGESEKTITPAQREFQWRVTESDGFERSIQMAYRQAIDQAEKYIYIETQYLIGSGKHWGVSSIANTLPERIVRRICERIYDNMPFHVYVVMPMFPEGDPISMGAVAVRQYEWKTMEYMAKKVWAAANANGKDWRDYLSFCFLAHWNTVDPAVRKITGSRVDRVKANHRYMIYVHSKLMMVDDRYLIFGSANLNERSLAGDRDLEIGCAMWPARGRESDCEKDARDFRKQLWTEHFATLPSSWEKPESPACIASFRKQGMINWINFRQLTRVDKGHLCIWPFHADKSAFYVERVSRAPEGDLYMPDGVHDATNQSDRFEWLWHSPGWHLVGGPAE